MDRGEVERPEKRHYSLICPLCGQRRTDDGLVLSCSRDHPPALLQTAYKERELRSAPGACGVFRYRSWLPVARTFPGAGGTAVLRSERICRFTGLSGLWLAFNGYWPEQGAHLETCTFKELEAYTVLGRLPSEAPVLVVASAGNTAAAFAALCSRYARPCLLIVPAVGLGRLRLRQAPGPHVRLVVVEGGDYADAIALAEEVGRRPGFALEGGVRNVARRDGLATVLYRAFEVTGRLPELYFQAVGSAAGAIAVHEAAGRLRAGTACRTSAPPRLLLSQNAGYAPVHDAWRGRTGGRAPGGEGCGGVFAGELVNRRPPFAVHSGVRHVLTESGGDVLTVDEPSARAAMEVFRDLESIDLEPAAAVAAASLFTAAESGEVPRDASVLLNVTGGGRARLSRDFALHQAEPDLLVRTDGPHGEAVERIVELFAPAPARPRRSAVRPPAPT